LEYQPQGARVASIHNGSSLFTGDAGSGESNIRRYLIENDLVDAIIQLPNNIFYNTGISTYVWILTNKKSDERKGKVQLIDASQAFEKLRKNQGSRNCTISDQYREAILKVYMDMKELEATDETKIGSKFFDGDDFRYYNVTIERPLRLKSQFNALRIDDMLYDNSDIEMSKWLYQTYGERVFSGLDDEVKNIKEYLNDNEIKITDKKLTKLISKKAWEERRNLQDSAKALMKVVGTEVFMDYNVFIKKVTEASKNLKLGLNATTLKNIARSMSVTDPSAAPVVKKEHKANSKDIERLESVYGVDSALLSDYGYMLGAKNTYIEYESDSDLRDSEKIPVKEDIYEYFQREVRPYVSDAWINLPPTKIGCEISFNKYFYKPAPLRSLAENEADILALDEQSQGFIRSLFNQM
jgi:type I restriction enzyme M protein